MTTTLTLTRRQRGVADLLEAQARLTETLLDPSVDEFEREGALDDLTTIDVVLDNLEYERWASRARVADLQRQEERSRPASRDADLLAILLII